MAVPLIRQLASRIVELQAEPLSDALIAKVKQCIIDFLAATFAGTDSGSFRAVAGATAARGGGNCTLIGLPSTGTAVRAALHNGIVGHAEELDDSHSGVSGLHLAATVIPAALALAEERGVSGRELIQALACGYEAAGRLCRCIDKAHRSRGFHSTGTAGAFGAAVACAVLLGLDGMGIVHSMGIAASSAAGLFAFLEDGATVKHFHAGRAALDGLTAALLASEGMTAPACVLEAREGFFHAYAGEYDSRWLFCRLEYPEIFSAYHKLYSACGHTFPAIDAALLLRAELQRSGFSTDAITHLRYDGYRNSAVLNNPEPKTIQECRFSIPCAVALALDGGNVSRRDMATFASVPRLLSLCRRIEVREDPALTEAFPALRAGILSADLADGRHLSFRIDTPKGMPENPASFEDIRRKFLTETASVLPPGKAAALLEAVDRLEQGPMSRLSEALR